jgi:hypothetical protein
MTARYGKLFGAMDKVAESKKRSSETGSSVAKGSPKGGAAAGEESFGKYHYDDIEFERK